MRRYASEWQRYLKENRKGDGLRTAVCNPSPFVLSFVGTVRDGRLRAVVKEEEAVGGERGAGGPHFRAQPGGIYSAVRGSGQPQDGGG